MTRQEITLALEKLKDCVFIMPDTIQEASDFFDTPSAVINGYSAPEVTDILNAAIAYIDSTFRFKAAKQETPKGSWKIPGLHNNEED